MSIEEQIKEYIAAQPEPKRSEIQELHRMILQLSQEGRLWFNDGKKFKTLKNINGKIFKAAIKYGLEAHNEPDEV